VYIEKLKIFPSKVIKELDIYLKGLTDEQHRNNLMKTRIMVIIGS